MLEVLKTAEAPSDGTLSAAFGTSAAQKLLDRVSSELLPTLALVNAGRRKAIRSAQLIANRRAVNPPGPEFMSRTISAWGDALGIISSFVDLLTTRETIAAVDAHVALLHDPTEPAAEILQTVATSGMGFSAQEYQWLMTELDAAGFECLGRISGGQPRVLKSICRAAAGAHGGLAQLGFVTLTDNDEVNQDLQFAFARARPAGVTVSAFHLLPGIVLVAAQMGLGRTTAIARVAAATQARFGLFGPGANRSELRVARPGDQHPPSTNQRGMIHE